MSNTNLYWLVSVRNGATAGIVVQFARWAAGHDVFSRGEGLAWTVIAAFAVLFTSRLGLFVQYEE